MGGATQEDVKDQLRKQADLEQQPDGGGQRKTIRQMLEDPKQQLEIAKALPNAMTPQRLARLVLTAINSTPNLQKCDAFSLLAAGMQCAALGLEPNTPLQHCWLLPFENRKQHRFDVQFVLGYQGMVDLALRSPRVKSVMARPVYEKDKWSCDLAADQIVHEPELEVHPGDPRFYYAVAHLTNSGRIFEPVPLWLIEEHRQMAAAPNSPAWTNHPDPMARKTCIRIIWRWLPKTAQAAQAIELDEKAASYEQWFGGGPPPIDVEGREEELPPDPPAPSTGDDQVERCAECGEVDGGHRDDCSLATPKK